MNRENKISVLLVQPMKKARMVEINDSLEAMQAVVGGNIEEYMPFEDDVALVCNEEGKMNGMELNRGIFAKDGQLQDIIAGPFFVCYAPIESENFLSLTPEFEKKYLKIFEFPEQFFRTENGIKPVPFVPESNLKSAQMER